MKFEMEAASLVDALKRVKGVVEKRNTIPILSNVAMRVTKEKGLSLTATDLDIEISLTVPATVEEAGSLTASADLLLGLTAKLPKKSTVALSCEGRDKDLQITCGRTRATLHTLPIEDFPSYTVDKPTHTFTLSPEDVQELFGVPEFAISKEATRYYLNGVYFHIPQGKKNKLRGVATDGHRLAYADRELPEGAADMPGLIVPRKTVTELLRLMDGAQSVALSMSATKITFDFGAYKMVSKVIDGTFPDYNRVIPTSNDKIMVADVDAMREAVGRAAIIQGERGKAVKLELDQGRIILSSTNPDSGSASEEMEVDYASDPLAIGFNSAYMAEILSQIEGDEVRIAFADPGSPTLIRPKGIDNQLFVLMPMRV
jgi:DNA polymerase III subunit beta